MTDTPTPGAAAELPVVAWQAEDGGNSFISQTAWENNSFYLSKYKIALTAQAPAQSQLDALREEVARLTKERDEARGAIETFKAIAIASNSRARDLSAELAALKAQPTDVDALMALADAYADALGRERCGMSSHTTAAREALRAKLAARKEEL